MSSSTWITFERHFFNAIYSKLHFGILFVNSISEMQLQNHISEIYFIKEE